MIEVDDFLWAIKFYYPTYWGTSQSMSWQIRSTNQYNGTTQRSFFMEWDLIKVTTVDKLENPGFMMIYGGYIYIVHWVITNNRQILADSKGIIINNNVDMKGMGTILEPAHVEFSQQQWRYHRVMEYFLQQYDGMCWTANTITHGCD